jgi:uncharacterized ferritin-like protein (DUF455 family)
MLEDCLEQRGSFIGEFSYIVPDPYELLAEQDLVYRLVILSRTGESESLEGLSSLIPQLESAGQERVARMYEYVQIDEARHTQMGNKWLRFLVGDDDDAVAEATRECVMRYNHEVRKGRLHRALRSPDYLTGPGAPVQRSLRELAGFTLTEIDLMVRSRGTAAQE